MQNRVLLVRKWLLILSLTGFVLFLLIGIVSLVAYFLLAPQERPIYGWRDPLDAVVSARVRPDLALLPLGGISSDIAVREALNANELDTAWAILVYAADLDTAARAGLFVLVGDRFTQAGRLSEAALCFQLAHDLAALGPDLADVARFDLSLAAARGRLGVKDEVGLALSLEQAETIIRHSARMQPVQRRQALERLAQVMAAARGPRAAAELRARLAEEVRKGPTQAPAPWLLTAFAAPLPSNPALEQIRQERQRRALILSDQWIALGGEDIGPELLDLIEFLQREERARIAWYTQLAESGVLSLDQRVTLLEEQVAWLLVKLQAARGAFGVSLMSDWEANELEIRRALATAQFERFALLRERVLQLSDPREAGQAELELVRLELANWRWGHYPGLDPDERDRALTEAVARVRGSLPDKDVGSNSGVFPAVQMSDRRRDYILVGGNAQSELGNGPLP
ncbi:MAG: hypothetical protein RML36_05035 [Anaerolineae bacterium]|nr:hypothetical protein [Anaerolineae bacterium]MDW8098839.1 hypothetical protein [Anaerolineae bacterium]